MFFKIPQVWTRAGLRGGLWFLEKPAQAGILWWATTRLTPPPFIRSRPTMCKDREEEDDETDYSRATAYA
jgi:hypothetical protein